MRRLLIAAFSGVLLANASSLQAYAMIEGAWCEIDPKIVVDGRHSEVHLLYPTSYQSSLTGPVNFVFHVPPGSKAHVTYPHGKGPINVVLRYDGPSAAPLSVRVEAWVTATATFSTKTVVLRKHDTTIEVIQTSDSPTTITYTLTK